MKTETLQERLARLLPGAKVALVPNAAPEARFVVDGWRKSRDGKAWEPAVLATGASEREAVNRALFLWSAQR